MLLSVQEVSPLGPQRSTKHPQELAEVVAKVKNDCVEAESSGSV